MKDKILQILVNHAKPTLDGTGISEQDFASVVNKIDQLYRGTSISELATIVGDNAAQQWLYLQKNNEAQNYSERKAVEVEFLEKYNRIKKHYCDKRGVKFVRARVVAKPSQLHARLKTYTMDELGTVIYNVFNDNFHVDTKWKYATTDYMTRQPTIEKYLN